MSTGESSFGEMLLPHLGAAYNLARWLTRNPSDADDIVQEAYLKALRSSSGYRGGDTRAWLLAIVRNAFYTSLRRKGAATEPLDEQAHAAPENGGPEALALRDAARESVRTALEQLPPEFREVVVLRDIEGLSYHEIAAATGAPIGTVMSRLARARKRLCECLREPSAQGAAQ